MASAANPSMGNYTTPSWVVNVRGEIGRSPAWEVGLYILDPRLMTAADICHICPHFIMIAVCV